MVFLPLLGQADFGNARSFVLHIGNHFVPYGLSNVLLENCQAASQTQ